jgi:DNA-binding NarL/FixJ family response regulator
MCRSRRLRQLWSEDDMIRLVLADDHGIVLSALASLLGSHADFEVVGEARDGREALRCIESRRPDIAVLDV